MLNQTKMSSLQPNQTIFDDHQLVDSAVYLASLASESKEIDPKLDIVRSITAGWDSQSPLDPKDRESLQTLISELKDYLINRDPLRSFTLKSLNDRLESGLSGERKKMPDFTNLVVGCIVVSMLLLLVPVSVLYRIYLASAGIMLCATTFAVWFYLTSLGSFKPDLRRAFKVMCLGAFFFDLFTLHYVATGLLQVTDLPMFRYGGAIEISLLGFVTFHVGLVKYAEALKISTKTINIRYIIGILLSIVLAVVIAIVRNGPNGLFFGISLAAAFVMGLSAFMSGRITKLLLGSLTASYTKSLRAIYLSQQMVPLATTPVVVGLIWLGQLTANVLGPILGLAVVPVTIVFMYSGYSFKQETSQ